MNKKSLQDLINEKQKNITPEEKDQLNSMARDLGKYRNMSGDQLLAEMMNLKKTAGGIDEKKLAEFREFVAPLLNSEQAGMLNSIIQTLK